MRFTQYINEAKIKKIGIIGYSAQKFDIDKAKQKIKEGLEYFDANINDELVSGYTDIGIPSISYRIAKKMKMKTIGIACSKAKEYKLFPVDKEIIVGDEWGDESDKFLSYITHLIKVGGGEQSKKEYKLFKGPKKEYKI